MGDKVLSMDGKATPYFVDLQRHVSLRSGSDINTVVLRDGREVSLIVRPEKTEQRDFVGGKAKVGRIGLGLDGKQPLVRKNYGVVDAFGFGVSETGSTIASTGTMLKRIFTGKEDTKQLGSCLLYTSPSPRDGLLSRMPSSA